MTRARTRVPALAGGFLTTVPPGKSNSNIFSNNWELSLICKLLSVNQSLKSDFEGMCFFH